MILQLNLLNRMSTAAKEPNQAVSNPTTLVIGISQEFESIHPLLSTTASSFYVLGLTNRALVKFDQNNNPQPDLAAEIPSFGNKKAKWEMTQTASKKSQKTLVVTWTLKENARWNDGTPITCKDLAFTRQVALDPNVAVREKEIFRSIKEIKWAPKQPKICHFIYEKPRWDFSHLTWFRPIPAHIEEPIYLKEGHTPSQYEKNSFFSIAPTKEGLANGPYQIKEYRLGSDLVFTKNKYFYGKSPYFDKIILKIIPNTATLETNLLSGNIDMISSLGISFQQSYMIENRLKSQNNPRYQVVYAPSSFFEHIEFNLDHEWLGQVNFRKALILGINRKELLDFLFPQKNVRYPHHFLPPSDPWFPDQSKLPSGYEFNLQKAASLLEEMGWVKNNDGFRYRNGKKLKLEIRTTAGNKTRELVLNRLKDQWKHLGIELELKYDIARNFFGEILRKRNFKDLVLYSWLTFPEETYRRRFTCDNIPSEKNNWSGQNYSGICHKELDRLIEELEREFSEEKRKEIFQKILSLYVQNVWGIPLYFDLNSAVIPISLKGFVLPQFNLGETQFIEYWSF
ncbi:MAG: peptide ABC transporter substrate-binding protein [Bdellovibrionaceae bacterium]|nr:peptide ABC transporter substrate-binding protein [Pseudobdellovibrionaceae bacterium]MDW8191263.1 peptide ABC transporter substrate-binding protein [Pseudobdellovibrionaceae bacterium]